MRMFSREDLNGGSVSVSDFGDRLVTVSSGDSLPCFFNYPEINNTQLTASVTQETTRFICFLSHMVTKGMTFFSHERMSIAL